MNPRRLLLLGLALAAGSSHAADLVPIRWDAAGVFRSEIAVPAGRFAEACGPLAARVSVAWTFDADAALDFNIHFHEGRRVEYPTTRADVSTADGTLRVTSPQEYCWMWTNRTGRDVRLTVTLRREGPVDRGR